jgi:excisionase family DNA binding protein
MRQAAPSPLDELTGKATITIEQTAKLFSLGRTAAYDAARRGELPTRRLGRRLLVPGPALLEWLGSGVTQGHIHKRVRTDRHGKETIRWYVVFDLGLGDDGRRRQKWHGGFRTRREPEAARALTSSRTLITARM